MASIAAELTRRIAIAAKIAVPFIANKGFVEPNLIAFFLAVFIFIHSPVLSFYLIRRNFPTKSAKHFRIEPLYNKAIFR